MDNKHRNAKITKKVLQGNSYVKVGKIFGMSKANVSLITRRNCKYSCVKATNGDDLFFTLISEAKKTNTNLIVLLRKHSYEFLGALNNILKEDIYATL